jgi:hypothetical protein
MTLLNSACRLTDLLAWLAALSVVVFATVTTIIGTAVLLKCEEYAYWCSGWIQNPMCPENFDSVCTNTWHLNGNDIRVLYALDLLFLASWYTWEFNTRDLVDYAYARWTTGPAELRRPRILEATCVEYDTDGPMLRVELGSATIFVRAPSNQMPIALVGPVKVGFSPEMAIDTSRMRLAPFPNGVMEIRSAEGDLIGTGFRTMDVIVTALHVVMAMGRVPKTFAVNPVNGRTVEIGDQDILLHPAYDVALVPLSKGAWASLGTKQLKLARVMKSGAFHINARDEAGQPSVAYGTALKSEKPFIFQHTASTVPGTSGAPLFGKDARVVGMHLGAHHGKGTNYGVAIGTLLMPLGGLEGLHPESFEDTAEMYRREEIRREDEADRKETERLFNDRDEDRFDQSRNTRGENEILGATYSKFRRGAVVMPIQMVQSVDPKKVFGTASGKPHWGDIEAKEVRPVKEEIPRPLTPPITPEPVVMTAPAEVVKKKTRAKAKVPDVPADAALGHKTIMESLDLKGPCRDIVPAAPLIETTGGSPVIQPRQPTKQLSSEGTTLETKPMAKPRATTQTKKRTASTSSEEDALLLSAELDQLHRSFQSLKGKMTALSKRKLKSQS